MSGTDRVIAALDDQIDALRKENGRLEAPPCGLKTGFKEELDAVLEKACSGEDLKGFPGVVVYAKRGDAIYHGAKGFANIESGQKMEPDSVFRMYSMTKVMTSTIALMLYEKGCFKLNDPVSKFIPSFDREFSIVSACTDSDKSVNYHDMLSGKDHKISYKEIPSTKPMLIKHCMSESSGVGYEAWSDLDRKLEGAIGFNDSWAIASALRQQTLSTFYKSSNILGHDATLEEVCDLIGNTGVLGCEPGMNCPPLPRARNSSAPALGTLSYGHGATVLARVIEVAYEQLNGQRKCLSAIFDEMLFAPLGMSEASFYLTDGDPRIARMPRLYGVNNAGDCVPAEESIPPMSPEYSNHNDHFAGPRKFETGDTGTATQHLCLLLLCCCRRTHPHPPTHTLPPTRLSPHISPRTLDLA
jgi:CubicO group peptidase (beta-lactamase class C family)